MYSHYRANHWVQSIPTLSVEQKETMGKHNKQGGHDMTPTQRMHYFFPGKSIEIPQNERTIALFDPPPIRG